MPDLDGIWRLTVLTSGRGSNMEAVIRRSLEDPACPYQVTQVISDRPCPATQKAQEWGIPAMELDRGQAGFQEKLLSALADSDLIVLAGFLSILTPAIIQAYPGRILNIHPSLLPRHGGPGMHGIHVHEAVLAAGDRESGCSCHLVTEAVDQGEVLVRRVVPVLPDDTPQSLQARILPLEHQCLVEGIFRAMERLQADTCRDDHNNKENS